MAKPNETQFGHCRGRHVSNNPTLLGRSHLTPPNIQESGGRKFMHPVQTAKATVTVFGMEIVLNH